ncbi:hypothetical protein E4P29_07885 [Rhodococcus sp. 1R11]|uniref:hypothetical protein n=1 Tax=Rhodococcus sp. 1R11 TaxID=2559614 RepID=UPI0010719FFF|nr:hypothetical protein [Rhodococcus sp. 1R11]TFI44664.1 hypothetical protein E4P29_07885 [Rhodococcus sp. 1R11]
MTSVLALLAAGLGLSPRYAASALVIQWASAFLVARRLGYSLGRKYLTDVAIAGVLVAAWAIIEFALKLHVYENSGTQLELGFWAEIRSEAAWQEARRGSVMRSHLADFWRPQCHSLWLPATGYDCR